MAHENAQLRVNSSTLRNKASELQNYNNQLRNALTTLDTNETTLAGSWEGDANTAFRNQYKQNRTKFDEFIKVVNQYVTALQNAAAEYDRREQQNVSTAKTR